jgi:hypothetical protein
MHSYDLLYAKSNWCQGNGAIEDYCLWDAMPCSLIGLLKHWQYHILQKNGVYDTSYGTHLPEKYQLLIVHSVVFGSFSDITSISDYIALKGRMIEE